MDNFGIDNNLQKNNENETTDLSIQDKVSNNQEILINKKKDNKNIKEEVDIEELNKLLKKKSQEIETTKAKLKKLEERFLQVFKDFKNLQKDRIS